MKTNKLYMLALAASAMALGSCSNEEVVETTQEAKPATMVFTAGLENGVSSRTALSGTSVNWVDGDAIKVFGGTTSELTASNISGTTCTFSGDCGTADEFYAVYPSSAVGSSSALSGTTITNVTLPAEQTAVEGSYDPAAAIMVATTTATDKNFQFKNANSLIKVTPQFDCSKIIVTATGCSLAGTATIAVSANPTVSDITDGSSTVTLVSPDTSYIQKNKTYYISVLPGVTASSVTIDFIAASSDDSGHLRFSKTKPSSVTFARNNIANFGTFSKSNLSALDYDGHNNNHVPCVDLGTGVLWAKYNIGYTADKPFGDYYAFGHTEPFYENYTVSLETPTNGKGLSTATPTAWKDGIETKGGYSWENNVYYDGSAETGTKPYKYVSYTDGQSGNYSIFLSSNDAATKNLEGGWFTPCADDFIALAQKCVIVWGQGDKYNDTYINGYKVYRAKNAKDKGLICINGKWYSGMSDAYEKIPADMTEITGDEATRLTTDYPTILSSTGDYPCVFFPNAGYFDGLTRDYGRWYGQYLSSSTYGSQWFYTFSFSSTFAYFKKAVSRKNGYPVRAICK